MAPRLFACRTLTSLRLCAGLTIVVFFALAVSPTLAAFQAPPDNDVSRRIAQLHVGDQVTLGLRDGTRVKGRLLGGTADGVIMSVKGEPPRTVVGSDIVSIRNGMRWWVKTLIGVGAVYGALLIWFLTADLPGVISLSDEGVGGPTIEPVIAEYKKAV